MIGKPKYNAEANLKMKPDYYDYENMEIEFGYYPSLITLYIHDIFQNRSQENFEIIKKIGRGKYSDVFEGINVIENKLCVIKCLKPGKLLSFYGDHISIFVVRKTKIKREIKILKNIEGGPNVIKLLDVVKDSASHTTSLV